MPSFAMWNKLLLGFLLLFSVGASAATYYIDQTCTNNGNGTGQGCASGAGASGAYNTAPTISDGNTYLFKGGTTYNGGVLISNLSGATGVTIGSYGTGRAKISVLRNVAGATNSANWTRESANVWYIPIYCASGPCASDIPTFACSIGFACNPTRLIVNGVELCKADRKVVSGSIPSYLGATTGCLNKWWYDTSTGRLYWWSPDDTNPALSITSMRGSHAVGNTPPNAGSGIAIYETAGGNLPPMVIENLEFEGGIYASIYIAGNKGPGITIRNNILGAYAKEGVRSDYYTATTESTDRVTIEDNVIDSRYESSPIWTYEGNVGFIHGVAQYGESDGWIIKDNTLRNWSHGAIYFYCDSNCASRVGSIKNAIIRDNTIEFGLPAEDEPGCAYCRGIGVDSVGAVTGTKGVYNLLFTGNLIKNQTARSQINGGPNIKVVSNAWVNGREDHVIHTNETTKRDISQAFSSQAYAGGVSDITYAHNVVSNFEGACAYFPNDSTYTMTGVKVINNLFLNCSTRSGNTIAGSIYYSDGAAPAGNMTTNEFKNNDFWSPLGDARIYYRTAFTTVSSVSPSGSDVWSGNVTVNPDIVGGSNPINVDGLKLKSNSALCRAGVFSGNFKDYWGRNIDILDPSIGAMDCNAEYNLNPTTIRTDTTTIRDLL